MKDMDELLKQNLLPDCVPDESLNTSILEKAKETQTMKHKTFRSGAAAAAAIAILAVGSVSAYAAYRYLTPSQVADEITDGGALAKAFESKDAVLVNETQKTAGYDITLMGLVSGKDLMPVAPEDSLNSISKEKTYAVLAIAKEDGSPMPGMQDNDYQIFCASALVKGKSFMDVNNGTLNAGAYAFEQDGVQYQILECDNLEIFANIGVYVGVVEDFGEESHAFTMDKETGEYRVDESYDGMKALFTIPLDKSKADDAAAEKFFQEIEAEDAQDSDSGTDTQDLDSGTEAQDEAADAESSSDEDDLTKEWMHNMVSFKNLLAPDAQEFLKQHAEVYFRETYTLNENGGLDVQTDAGEAEYDKDTLPKEAGVETVSAFSSDGTLAGTFGDSITKNEDGTYTYTVYRPINLK